MILDSEFPEIIADQMRREGQNKAVPIVNGSVAERQFVDLAI
jgi:hypothetical protein